MDPVTTQTALPPADPTAVVGRRVLAYVIDGVILLVVMIALFASLASSQDQTTAFAAERVCDLINNQPSRDYLCIPADTTTIDSLIKSLGFRMRPFELIDLIGCDVNLATTQAIYDAYFQEPKYRPHPIQRHMVESGRLGRKTNRGFYKYNDS